MPRYDRHIRLSEIGPSGQDKLLNSRVLVVGAGGLGCPALQYLVAAGVGTIGIMDFDVVEESNLQRQILFGSSSLGMNKALAAKNRLEDLNPTITINAYPEKLNAGNVLQFISEYDLIIDGSDNFETRYLINDASILTEKAVVYGAIYKFEGQVSVFNYKNGPSYRCLFPEPPKMGSFANCSEIGVLGVLPGIIGAMQANEALKIILSFEHVLSGVLLCYNAKTATTINISIKRSESEIDKVLRRGKDFKTSQTDILCESDLKEISIQDALQMTNAEFIDIREYHEQPKIDLSNLLQIPLGQIGMSTDQLSDDKAHILFCQTGIRSQAARSYLIKQNIKNCYSLIGGVEAIIEHFKENVNERS